MEAAPFCARNLVIWFVGFVIYRLLMRVDILLGSTLPDMLITMALCIAVEKGRKAMGRETLKNTGN